MQFWMLKEFVLNFGTTDLSDFFLRQFEKPIERANSSSGQLLFTNQAGF